MAQYAAYGFSSNPEPRAPEPCTLYLESLEPWVIDFLTLNL